MGSAKRLLVAVLLTSCLAWLAACDSSNGRGGGTTPATGYSQADLAGRWNFVVTGVIQAKGYMVIDGGGNVTDSVGRSPSTPRCNGRSARALSPCRPTAR